MQFENHPGGWLVVLAGGEDKLDLVFDHLDEVRVCALGDREDETPGLVDVALLPVFLHDSAGAKVVKAISKLDHTRLGWESGNTLEVLVLVALDVVDHHASDRVKGGDLLGKGEDPVPDRGSNQRQVGIGKDVRVLDAVVQERGADGAHVRVAHLDEDQGNSSRMLEVALTIVAVLCAVAFLCKPVGKLDAA